jgi:tRNA1(Val) A37 N6-methylase TrmN6
VRVRPGEGILDLGCGIGAVLLLLAWRFPFARCIGIEAEPQSADLARRSIAWNGVDDRCEVRIGDLRTATADDGSYDLVTGTPPYLPLGTATEPQRAQQTFCHLEHRGGIEEYCAAAARRMTAAGRFVACHPDHDRVDRAAASAGLVIEARRDVIPRAGKRALFALYQLRRAAWAGARADLPPLVVRDRQGRWTEEFRALRERMGLPKRV